jgi:DNA topoisomerase-1
VKVVLVESPTKVKSISKYLGRNYRVLATYGHVRDLPSKTGSVNPGENFALTWQVLERAEKALKAIVTAVKPADTLILATDPDREGEAISWHVLEYLKSKNLLEDKEVQRVAFNAITKTAILEAIAKPRTLNQELIDAYLARLSLDYLVGFNLSPVLWRKLPGSRSAGRVQSVSLRLVVEREHSIETFVSQEYWTLEGQFRDTPKATPFKAKLVVYQGEKLEKFSLSTQEMAQAAVTAALAAAAQQPYQVVSVEKKRVKRNPPPPFTTSTLQQEASRKLGMSPSRTMTLAQKLYEGIEINGESTGLITYIRTDSVNVTPEGVKECCAYIEKQFGQNYLPSSPRMYKTKAKNAQEAHEAIRPTDLNLHPQNVAGILDNAAFALYELIWKRMVASQMAQAEFDQVGVDIASAPRTIVFRATGSTMAFDGFLKLYQEGRDEGDSDDFEGSQLPVLQEGQSLLCDQIDPFQHFTQPLPRYSEASLIKKMEELGIGRPSTYARIMQVLKDRNYVRMEKRNLVPEERGRLVTTFLMHYFKRYVEYDFTANLEEQLDDISSGAREWKEVLKDFWATFHDTVKAADPLKIQDVLETLEKDLAFHLFPKNDRACPDCKTGVLGLRLGKFGAFLGCSQYPTCAYTRPLDNPSAPSGEKGDDDAAPSLFPKVLGTDPQTDEVVAIRLGPYGLYLQWGEGAKPKRVSLPKGYDTDTLTLDNALIFGALPRPIGVHPESQLALVGGIGRFGPYIKHGDAFVSAKELDLILKGSLEEVVAWVDFKASQPKRPPRGGFVKKALPPKKTAKAAPPKAAVKKPAAPKPPAKKAPAKKAPARKKTAAS